MAKEMNSWGLESITALALDTRFSSSILSLLSFLLQEASSSGLVVWMKTGCQETLLWWTWCTGGCLPTIVKVVYFGFHARLSEQNLLQDIGAWKITGLWVSPLGGDQLENFYI